MWKGPYGKGLEPLEDQIAMEKKKNKRSAFSKNLHEFADVATTHGVRYALAEDMHWFERSLWTCIVIVATFCAIYASASIFIAWQDSPVLTTIGTMSKDITDMDFPAITLCSQGNNIKDLPHLPYLLPDEWSEFWQGDKASFEALSSVEKNDVLTAFMVDQVSFEGMEEWM